MTSTNDLMNHPRLSFEPQVDGSTKVVFAMHGWGADVVCRYWSPDNVREGNDRWRYELEQIEGKGGTSSHPSEHGCRIAIIRHLIEAGLIEIPEDNSHLDDRNRAELVAMQAARDTMTGRPRVGDFVIMPDGRLERCCHATPHGMQTTGGGSFNVMHGGSVSYSGGLNPPRLWEYFKLTGETKGGRFWFFSHGIAGAGRGVQCTMPCRVYRLEPRTMTEREARAHPMARRYAEVWGEDHADHRKAIEKLMAGEA